MINIKYIFSRIKDVKLKDYASFFLMIIALLLKPFYRKRYKGAWLICEEPLEARDNGWAFFQYMCNNHKEKKCYFAIKKKSVDYHKVSSVGECIEYGSIAHWLAYFLCDYNISSQKGGKPNAPMCALFELNGFFRPNNIFLQHGVIINDTKWLYRERSKIDMFITSTISEYSYIKEKFGYESGVVQLTGLPRFDNLHENVTKKNQIVIMPTWRNWFLMKSKQDGEADIDVKNSEYIRKWKSFLNSEQLGKMIKEYNLTVIFYPHRNIQYFLDLFDDLINDIIVADEENYEIQTLLKESSMLITDYSSVFFDMVYMKKPILFYQFDIEKFRKYQYGEGYFKYSDNPFGESFSDEDLLLSKLKEIIENNYVVSNEYLMEHQRIFKYWDTNNSERIYRLLCKQE